MVYVRLSRSCTRSVCGDHRKTVAGVGCRAQCTVRTLSAKRARSCVSVDHAVTQGTFLRAFWKMRGSIRLICQRGRAVPVTVTASRSFPTSVSLVTAPLKRDAPRRDYRAGYGERRRPYPRCRKRCNGLSAMNASRDGFHLAHALRQGTFRAP